MSMLPCWPRGYRNLPAMQETLVQALGWEDSPGEANGNPLQYPSWRISWTEEPGRLQSMGSHRVGQWVTEWHTHTHTPPPLMSSHLQLWERLFLPADQVLPFIGEGCTKLWSSSPRFQALGWGPWLPRVWAPGSVSSSICSSGGCTTESTSRRTGRPQPGWSGRLPVEGGKKA